MATERIADMTREELDQFVGHSVERHLKAWNKPKDRDNRTTSELLEALDTHRITPPAGAKSAREMLREDRDA
jgi:hypothetical protein